MSVYNYPNGGQDNPGSNNGGNGRAQQTNGNASTNGYGSSYAGSTYLGGSTYGDGESTYGGPQAPSNNGPPGYAAPWRGGTYGDGESTYGGPQAPSNNGPPGYAAPWRGGNYPGAGGSWTPSLAMGYMSSRSGNGSNPHAGPYTAGGATYNDVDRSPEESMGGHWPGTNGSHAGLHGNHGYGGYWPGTTPMGGGYMPERAADIARTNAAAGRNGLNNLYRQPPWMGGGPGGNGEGYGRGRGGP